MEDGIRAALEDVIRVRELKRQSSDGPRAREFYKEMISLPMPREERKEGRKALDACHRSTSCDALGYTAQDSAITRGKS